MEDVRCIFCNQGRGKIVIEENGYKGEKCFRCGLIFISPRNTFSETLNLYVHDQGLTSADMHIADAYVKRLHAKHNFNIIKKYRKEGAILEIGSGAGYFLEEARKNGFEPFGIEPNKTAAKFITNTLKIPCEETALSESTFGENKFDIIYHCNVLSHLHDPIVEFKKIHEKLMDNGIIVVETGNIGEIKEEYYSLFDSFGYPDHLFFFGEDSIRSLLEFTEFDLIKVYKYSILWYLRVQKIKQRIKDLFIYRGAPSKSPNNSKEKNENSSSQRFEFQKAVKNIYKTMLYLIRYKVGYLLPKSGRPQTMIIIARKKGKSKT